jgi:universal stress protein A
MLQKILVPTDHSKNSEEAFQYALDWAKINKSTIYVVHVIDLSYPELTYLTKTGQFDEEQNIFDEAFKETDEFINRVAGNEKGMGIERLVKKGDPSEEIIRAAKEKEADLIIMSTHGRKGLSHVLIGSVAEKVVRSAPCPVLTLKPKNFEFKLL